jgi:hypothetical protein
VMVFIAVQVYAGSGKLIRTNKRSRHDALTLREAWRLLLEKDPQVC